MKKALNTVCFAALIALSLHLPMLADSPLTSTTFSAAYQDLPLVAEAQKTKILSVEMAAFLTDQTIPLDYRLALVNALGWTFEGQHNHELFIDHLGIRYQQKGATPDALPLTAEEQLLLGYMTAMDDYFHPELGLPLVRRGARQLWQSQAAQLILAVTEAQDYIPRPKAWCQVWRMTAQALAEPGVKPDMRPEGRDLVLEYMSIYADECQPAK